MLAFFLALLLFLKPMPYAMSRINTAKQLCIVWRMFCQKIGALRQEIKAKTSMQCRRNDSAIECCCCDWFATVNVLFLLLVACVFLFPNTLRCTIVANLNWMSRHQLKLFEIRTHSCDTTLRSNMCLDRLLWTHNKNMLSKWTHETQKRVFSGVNNSKDHGTKSFLNVLLQHVHSIHPVSRLRHATSIVRL